VFKTSTLQQAAVNKLGFPSSKTMSIAQKLYEGIDLKSETVGLITYMRTDSERVSPVFINETFEFIKNNYGQDYVGVVKKTKKKETDQDAHEGIRPTSIKRTPESIKSFLSNDEYKLYSLIYYRALASLMANAKTNATTLILENNGYNFNSYHDSHCEGPYCSCDERRYGSKSSGSSVVAIICIGLALLMLLVFPPLGFIIFWGWVFCSK